MNTKTLTFAAAITAIAVSTTAFAGELPTYEANGFPVTPVQVGVLGAANVQQQATAPATDAHTCPGERADAAQDEDRDHR